MLRPFRIACTLAALASAASLAQPPGADASGQNGGARDAGVRPAATGPAPLLPRAHLLGNPERSSPQLAPDAKRLAWLAPDEKNVLQLWVRTMGLADDAPVTAEARRGLRSFTWAEDSTTLLYVQDANGDENFHLVSVDLLTKNTRDLTPWLGVRAELLALSPRIPDALLVGLNVRDRKFIDVWRVSLKTGAVELDTQNPGDVTRWVADGNLQVRAAVATTKEGGTEVRVRDGAKAPWRPLVTVGLEESLAVHGLSLDGKTIYLETTIAADTSRLVEKGLKSGTERVMAQNPALDVGDVWLHPGKLSPQAVRFEVDGRPEWTVLDYNVGSDFTTLKQQLGTGNFDVTSIDRADQQWVVRVSTDVGPPRWVLWERKPKRLSPLFAAFPKLDGASLAATSSVSIPVRDGFSMQGYLTVPVGPEARHPVVLLVHGGPWTRDHFGFSAQVQWLANRGYTVLQVNFRGSRGFGKRFLNAGNKQWGLAMQEDLTAAAGWVRDSGLALDGRVAIMGTSYGGYAALAGLAFTPEVYACGVDAQGPSNLFTLLASLPPYWEARRLEFSRRIGDPTDPADVELLTRASPLSAAERITAPLFIAHGANDPRVKQAESDQMFAALEKRSVPVTYVLYGDEGHAFARPENRLDFAARVEAFLAKCLGGRSEPLPRDGRIEGASPVVRVSSAKK